MLIMPQFLGKQKLLNVAEVMVRLGFKTRKSVHDLVTAGKLTPVRPPIVQGRGTPRVYFDEQEVMNLVPQSGRLSRQEVSARLGISVRAVDRLADKGVLTRHEAAIGKGRGGQRVEFDADEVETLKAQIISSSSQAVPAQETDG